jgi:serine/threonine protein phosphatase PrpC
MATVTNRSPLGLGALLGRLWNRPRLWRRTAVSLVAASDVGTQRRNNEDYYLIADLVQTAATIHGNEAFGTVLAAQPVLVVADGMGGAAGGEVASGMAATVIWSQLGQASHARRLRSSYRIRRSLLDAFRVANDRIRACAAKSPDLVGMGTTATAATVLDSELYVAHVGDSRAYLVRDRRAQRITTDHSVLQHLIDSGATGAAAAAAEHRHALLRALGPEADVRVDVTCMPVEHGDVVLLCSDGVWSAIGDDELATIVGDARDLRGTCSRLLALANERGGRDNATVLLARVETVTD